MGALDQIERASGDHPMPDARTKASLPPLSAYFRVGATRNLSWGTLGREIISLLRRTGTPWGAYGIAEKLGRDGPKRHPNSVYRSLRALEAARLVIPIVSWSRYVISPDPGISSWGVILCSRCRSFAVVPMPDEREQLWSIAKGVGFQPARAAIECISTCQTCAAESGSEP